MNSFTLPWGRALVIIAVPYVAYTSYQVTDMWKHHHHAQAVGTVVSTAIFIPIAMAVTRVIYSWYGKNVYARRKR